MRKRVKILRIIPRDLKPVFTYLLTYNVFFLILQILVITLSHINSFKTLSYPWKIYVGISIALGIQIMLCLLLTGLQTWLLWGVSPLCQNKNKMDRMILIVVILSLIAMLTANCYFFPLSVFSRPFTLAFPSFFINTLCIISLALLSSLAVLTLWRCISTWPGSIGLVISVLLLVTWFHSPKPPIFDNKEPNLVIIGIDSLSPSQVTPDLMPNVSAFLKDSVHFQETISPLARTTPAWISILTGLYPLNHGARENLYPPQQVRHDDSLAWILQDKGYRTIFATDDRRFNNIDKTFGFAEIIGPNIGIYDILLGSFYDFPLSNFIINSRIGQWLLPWNYMNRAGYFSYYPSTFDKAIQRIISQDNDHRPMFMAVHFTMPHWPYAWARSKTDQITFQSESGNNQRLYHQAIQIADQQVGRLLDFLKKAGILKNSMVILLSDHGESLFVKGARKTQAIHYKGKEEHLFTNYLKRKTDTELETSGGHGSDLLSPDQFNCLTGFQLFENGKRVSKAQSISTRIALIDIAPTLAEFFHFSLKQKPDGVSLLDTIKHQAQPVKNRFLMLESGLLPNMKLNRKNLEYYARQLYNINPLTLRIELRKDRLAYINSMKLYGIIYNEWLLALYPDDQQYIPVLLNLRSGDWSDNADSDFIKTSPFQQMLTKLRQFYAKDLASYPAPQKSGMTLQP